MCGIAGLICRLESEENLRARCRSMVLSISHRGPEGSTVWSSNGVALGHARLSFQDLQRPEQPVVSECGNYALVLNGEVYNHLDLRRDHLDGVTWRSDNDAETILQLFMRFGTRAFSLLSGMFAVALLDIERKAIVLVRDKLGKKPLYYSAAGGDLRFASELSALKDPAVRIEIDRKALSYYLKYQSTPADRSMLSGIKKVPPGGILEWDSEGSKESAILVPEGSRFSTHQLSEAIGYAVERRIHADRGMPVGVFLSGGIDSALIANVAKNSGERIISYSFRPANKDNDETDTAHHIAKLIGIEHKIVSVEDSDVCKLLMSTYKNVDEPIADPSFFGLSALCSSAAQDVKYVLTGDGADEFFLGYEFFHWAQSLSEVSAHLPRLVVPIIRKLLDFTPDLGGDLSLLKKLRMATSSISETDETRFLSTTAAFTDAEIRVLTGADITYDEPATPWLKRFSEKGPIRAAQRDAIQHFLCGPILAKLDRASMRYGIEIRSPFLDDEIISLTTGYGRDQLLSPGIGKVPLRELVRENIDPRIASLKKRGFRVSHNHLLIGQLRDAAHQYILGASFTDRFEFDRPILQSLLDGFFRGREVDAKKIWSLLCLAAWSEGLE